ncbi:MAG TPA: DUF2911 domain-containing protein [Gemmatimonadaceae bacterium]|nr:DUF2911 domain-containing protein [Gemmatimonadaceae bacterium]
MSYRTLLGVAGTTLLLAGTAAAQAPESWVITHDEGAFYVTLGKDTLLVEQFMVHGPTLKTTVVTRSPRTMTRVHDIKWNDAGAVESYTVTMGEQTRSMELPAEPMQVVFAPPLVSPYVVLARIAAATNASTVTMGNIPLTVTRADTGWIVFSNDELGTIRVRLDDQLRAQEVDARNSALGGHALRIGSVDAAAEAARFAALDAAGQGLGPLSPPDSIRAQVGGANIAINYHRPSMRGRTIFGGVVPLGRVWRTGANQATSFTTDRDLMIGDTRVPAGAYTVWSLPSESGWHLILNKQTGQWGTEYNAEQDLAHIPMSVETLSSPVEQFAIAVAEDGTLSLVWSDRRATVPVKVAP